MWPLVRIETANQLDAKQSVQDVLGIYDEPSHCNLDVKHAMKATPGGRAWRAAARQTRQASASCASYSDNKERVPEAPRGLRAWRHKDPRQQTAAAGPGDRAPGLLWRTKESSAPVSTRLIPQQVKPKRSSTKQP